MSRAEKHFLAILDCLFAVMVGVLLLLLLLRSISKAKKLVIDSSSESAANVVNITSDLRANKLQAIQSIEETIVNAPEAANKIPANVVESEMPSNLVESETETASPQELGSLIEKAEAYCVKCREKREMQGVHRVVTKNGRNALEGMCPVCGTKLFRFIAR